MRLCGTSTTIIIKWTRLRIGGCGFECLFFHRLTARTGLLLSAFTVSNITDCICIIAGAEGSAQWFSAQYRSAQCGGLGSCFISTFRPTLIRFSPRIARSVQPLATLERVRNLLCLRCHAAVESLLSYDCIQLGSAAVLPLSRNLLSAICHFKRPRGVLQALAFFAY